jgi:hypothetical protein
MPKRGQEAGYDDHDKVAVRLTNTHTCHALEDDELKRDGDVTHVLPARAAALIQQGYAVAVEDDKPAPKGRAKK